MIPAWIGALLRGETAYINGDGSAARDFCHVDNVVQMNLRAGDDRGRGRARTRPTTSRTAR